MIISFNKNSPPFLRNNPDVLREMELNESDEITPNPDEQPDVMGNLPLQQIDQDNQLQADNENEGERPIDLDPPSIHLPDENQGIPPRPDEDLNTQSNEVDEGPDPEPQTDMQYFLGQDQPPSQASSTNTQTPEEVEPTPGTSTNGPTPSTSRGFGAIRSNIQNISRFGLRSRPPKKVMFDL